MKRIFFGIFLLTILGTTGCIKDEIYENKQVIPGNYMPIEIGNSLTYQVDTVYFMLEGNNIIKDSTSWIQIETIVDTSRADDGRLLYSLLRQKYKEGQSDTIIDGEWKIWEENRSIIRQEGNLPYIKMKKDVYLGETWDPNTYFDAQSIELNIKSNMIKPFPSSAQHLAKIELLDTYDSGDYTFNDVVLVNLVDEDDNLIEKRFCEERYGRDIGLIHRREITLNTQCRIKGGNPVDCTDLHWYDKAEEGYIIEKKILKWN